MAHLRDSFDLEMQDQRNSEEGDVELNKPTVYEDRARGWKRMCHLPYEPAWYNILLFMGALQVCYVIYIAGFRRRGKKDNFLPADFTKVSYIVDGLYFMDAILMIASKNIRNLFIPPTAIQRPYWIIGMDFISILPLEVAVIGDSNSRVIAKTYYVIQINRCLKIVRVFYHFYEVNLKVTNSKLMNEILRYHFALAVATTITFVTTYNIICSSSTCPDPMPYKLYVEYLQIALSLITGRGAMESYPSNIYWVLTVTIVQIFTFMYIICATMGQMVIVFITLLKHKRCFYNKMIAIKRVFKRSEIPKDVSDICMEYFEMIWHKQKGFDRDTNCFAVIPKAMFEEICLDVRWYALKHSKLLKARELPFLRHLAGLMFSENMLPETTVFHQGEMKDRMIYIVSGVMQLLSEEDNETPIMSFSGGTCLGESSLLLNCRAKAAVRCKSFCQIHVLRAKDFYKAAKLFPIQFNAMRKDFKERMEEARKLHKLSKAVNEFHQVNDRTDHITIMWLKTTLHKLMIQDGDTSLRHQCQNVFLRDEFTASKFADRCFSADNLSMYAIAERLELVTDLIFLKTSCPCIFQPDSIFVRCWEMFIVLLTCVAAISIPYVTLVVTPIPTGYMAWLYMVTVIWALDLYLQISTGIRTSEEMLASVKRVFLYRFSQLGFIADIMSAVPLELFASVILAKTTANTRALLHCNRIIKIWRVKRAFSIWQNKVNVDNVCACFVKYLVLFSYLIFLFSCVLFATNCFDDVCTHPLIDNSVAAEMLWCVVVVSQMFSGVTLGSRLSSLSTYDTWYATINIIATFYFIYTCAKVATAFALERKLLVRAHETYADTLSILDSNEVREQYNSRIFNYVETQWIDNHGSALAELLPIVSFLPKAVEGVYKEAKYMKFLRSTPIFQNYPQDAIYDICLIIRESIMPPNEVVSYMGDICSTFHILTKGYCTIFTGFKKVIGPVTTISVLETFLQLPAVNTVVTLTHCEVLSIDYDKLNVIYMKYPLLKQEIDIAFELVDIDTHMQAIADQSQYNARLFQDDEWSGRKSIYKFGYSIPTDSFREYDYYIPFDRLYIFSFLRYFLQRFIIMPNGTFFFVCEIVRCVCAILSGLFFPLNEIGTCRNCFWYYLLIALDAMAWFDIYLRLHVAYYNKDGLLVYHPLRTATHYLTTNFLIDLIAVFPMQVFFAKKYRPNNKVLSILQVNRVIQLYRYWGFASYLEHRNILPNPIPLVKYFPVVLLLSTAVGSVLINIVCSFGRDIRNPPGSVYLDGVVCEKESGIADSAFTKPLSSARVQVYGIYFSTAILTVAGMRGFRLGATFAGVVAVILSIFSYIFAAHLMGTAISLYTIEDSTLFAYQDAMKYFRKFMKMFKVDRTIQQQAIAHYALKWHRKRGRDVHKSIARFNRPMQQDILYDIYGITLKETSIFGHDSESFLRSLLLQVSHDVIAIHSYIIQINDINANLFLITKGEATVTAPGGATIATLKQGSIFGNLDGCPMMRQTIGVMSSEHVEILIIPSVRFHAILKSFPHIQKRYKALILMHIDYIEGYGKSQNMHVKLTNVKRRGCGLCKCWINSKLMKVIDPQKMWLRIWQAIILIVVCIGEVYFNLYQLSMGEYHIVYIVFQYTCDALFIANFFILTHTAYEDEVGTIVTDLDKICRRLRANQLMFWFTIISMIPIDIIAWFVPTNWFTFAYPILRFNRLLRFSYIPNYFNRQQQRLTTNAYILRIVYIFIWTTFIIHLATCVLITVASLHKPNMHPDLQYDRINDTVHDKFTVYITAYYTIVSIFTRISQSESYPESSFMITYCIVLMVLFQLLGATMLAQIFATIQVNFNRQMHYTMRYQKIYNFIVRENASPSLLKNANDYLDLLWKHQQGGSIPRLLIEITPVLRQQILNSAFAQHITNHFVFCKCHADFNRQMVSFVTNRTLFVDNYVVFQGAMRTAIFFIQQGGVAVIDESDTYSETIVEHLQAGDCFGVTQGLFPDKPFKYTFRSTETTVILVLDYAQWKHLLKFYPASHASILERYSQYVDKYV